MKLKDLSQYYNDIKIIRGDEEVDVAGISHVWEPAQNKFCFVKSEKFLKILKTKDISTLKNSGLLIYNKFYESKKADDEFTKFIGEFSWLGTVENIEEAMCLLSKPFYDEKFDQLNYLLDGRQLGSSEVDPTAEIAQGVFIGANTKIGKNVQIYPGSVIMPNVEIGENSIIFANVTVYPYVTIGKNTRIHSQVVIGGDGFGYNYFNNQHNKIWHFSGVEIGDHVEIGANSTVDSGAFIPTRVGDGSIIDSAVLVAHNVQIKKNVVLCGQVAVAGSATIEDLCMVGGDADIGPGSFLGQGSQVGGAAVVSENMVVEQGSKVAGHPARNVNEWMKGIAFVRRESLKGKNNASE